MGKDFCKVLLLGEPFNDYTGMGVTLTNLFKEWPKESIAVASKDLDTQLCDAIRPCSRYVVLSKPNRAVVRRSRLEKAVRYILRELYLKLGLSDRQVIPVSEEIKQCLNDFKPDIIFSALGSLDRMNYLQSVMRYAPHSKYVIYITDDWCNTAYNGRIFKNRWKREYHDKIMEIISNSALNLSICSYMSEAYKVQFGFDFIPFHNPVDTKYWNSVPSVRKYPDDTFAIIYVGKINKDTKPRLKKLSHIVEKLNKEGQAKVVFDIYSPSTKDVEEFSNFDHCKVLHSVPNSQIPELLKSYDCLFLPLGFSQSSRLYTRLSMPTKLTEYMASGVPMIVNCPVEIALSKYVTESKCAFVCNEQNENALKETLLTVISDRSKVEEIVIHALEEAQHHDIAIIRERFRSAIVYCMAK